MYEDLVREHFERCLDLYMCPRMTRKKMNVTDPNTLIPELPSPNDLKPFPTSVSIEYKFHKSCVRSISVSPCGRYLASGDEDHNVVVWDMKTSRVLRKYKFPNAVIDCLEWCPSESNSLLAVVNEEFVFVVQTALNTRKRIKKQWTNLSNFKSNMSVTPRQVTKRKSMSNGDLRQITVKDTR